MVTETLPPEQDLKAEIKKEHLQAELLRLRAGYDGCGCADCQGLYQVIDLKKYGARVKRYFDTIIIMSGQTGADLWEQYHPPEPGGDDVLSDYLGGQAAQQAVSKLPANGLLPPGDNSGVNPPAVMKHPGGRPRKSGEVSRVTAWRREKEKQLELELN